MTTQRPTAVFRADASIDLGGGHVMRCLTLAGAFADEGWHVGFAVNAEALSVVPSLTETVVSILVLDEVDEVTALRERWPDGVALLIVDHYGLDSEFEQRCRPWAATILAIDDLANRRHRADLLLDQTHGREEACYRDLTGPDCTLLLGARFALLRPQFQAHRRRALGRRESTAPAERLLISFGATDPAGIAATAMRAVARACPDLSVDVVAGATSHYLDEIRRLAAALSPAVTVHGAVDDIASLMADADFVIGACGGTSWERCCLGLPTLAVVTADNQRQIARALAAAGAIELVGNAGEVTVDTFAARVAALRDDAARRRAMARAAAAICDGNGAARVTEVLLRETMAGGPGAYLLYGGSSRRITIPVEKDG
ncbi:MAG: UDP-2,4-diacetamido-2,4,6-trideoxy-beta-L-altropyranose hydrolase [Gammaproteobacteria bacterium]|nr:UDP-2,4-diacetamido-2,4,6-trideoxy-beta-L-altropyranose hydrolase [Gammaproteobacteria bacterium]